MMVDPAKRRESDVEPPRAPRVRTVGESSRRGSSSGRESKSSQRATERTTQRAAERDRERATPRTSDRRPPGGRGGSGRRRPAPVSNRPGAKKRSSGMGRVIAPIALIIFAIACFSIVSSKDDTKTDKADAAKASTTTKSTGKATTDGNGNVTVTTKKTYTVKAGDSFAAIAEKLNIDVDTLSQLNSGVDPRALQPGQKLKLR